MSIFSVSSTAELEAALKSASGGDVIELAAGDYGSFSMRRTNYDSEVIVKSADPDDPAVFNKVKVSSSSNLTFDSIFINFIPTEHTVEWESAFDVTNGSQIALRNSKIEGGDSIGGVPSDSESGEQGKHGILGEPIARAITIKGTNITIESNEITHFKNGIVMGGDGHEILDNEIYGLRTSPIRGGGSDLTIDGNYFHDSNPWNIGGTGDHGNYIHFWTSANGQPMENITITNNIFSDENGGSLLGIYLDDNKNETGYKNVTVEDNVIYSRTGQAVRFENVSDASISRNTILNPDDAEMKGSQIIFTKGTENIHLENNIISTFFGDSTQQSLVEKGFTFSNNLDVNYEDPNAENFIGRILTDSRLEGSGLWERAVVPGSVADGLGATRMHLDDQPNRLTPIFQVEKAGENGGDLILRADLSRGPDGYVAPSDAQFIWDFGDGTGGIGQVVRHTYAEAGRFGATLTLVTADGASAMAKSEIGIMGAEMLSFDPQTGFFEAEGYGEATAIQNSDRASTATDDGYGIDLGNKGIVVSVDNSQIARLFGAESFDMSMTLRADTLGSTGEVARVHGNFILSVENRGEVSFKIWTDEGSTKLTATRVTVNDGVDHDIRIVFNSETSRLEMHVDDALAAATEVDGTMRGDYPRDLVFGNPWGKQNFDGTLTAFDLSVGNQDYPDYAGDVTAIQTDAIPVDDAAVTEAAAAGLTAEYFVLQGGVPLLSDIDFDRAPDATGVVNALDFAKSDTPFWEGGPADNFAARYTGALQVETAGTYTFYLTSDDGSALFLDGARVIDNDGAHATTTREVTLDLAAGAHALELLYFENGGVQTLELDWQGPDTGGARRTIDGAALAQDAVPSETVTDAAASGLSAEYFVLPGGVSVLSDIDFDRAPDASGVVSALDFAKSDTPFWEGGPADNFAARYTGALQVETAGTYTFYLTSDDGSALYLDGAQVIDNDGAHATTTREVTLDLAAGAHALELLYFENGGVQTLELDWQGPDTDGVRRTIDGAALAQDAVPSETVTEAAASGLSAEYFVLPGGVSVLSDIDFDRAPDASGVVNALDFAKSDTPFWEGGPADNFAARYTGALQVETAGTYTFYLTSDDGSALFLDGAQVIDNDGDHGARLREVTLDLAAGAHALELLYFENAGNQVLELDWQGPDTGGARRTIDGAALAQDAVPSETVPPDDSEAQAPTVIIDAEADRLEVVLDGNAALDMPYKDPVTISPVSYEWGGSISAAWTHHYDSDVSNPEDSEAFVDDAAVLSL